MRQVTAKLLIGMPLVALFALGGCRASGVGDPCVPEVVPSGGFNAAEAYLETSSVQCRTRVCMVYQLAGDPRMTREECDLGPAACAAFPTAQDVDERVYCTCRCDAPAGTSAPLCECGEGFRCTEVLDLGGDGIRGSYCVREETLDDV